MIVSDRIRADLAAVRTPLAASANCLFEVSAMYRGKLAVAVAARSAAVQLERRSRLTLSSPFSTPSRESWSLKATIIREITG